MKRLIILNPWAGRGAAGQQRPALERALEAASLNYDLVTTHARGGATELTYQALERGYEQIIAVGGDGTLNEIINGLIGAHESSGCTADLGIVPLGTGSDFVKSFDNMQPGDVQAAVRRVAAARRMPVDAGRVIVEAGSQETTRCFINGLGMGLDAQVAVESLKLTRLKGLAVYLVAIIRALAHYQPRLMTVRYDEQTIRRRMLFATVANGRCQGGAFYLTPEAQIDDGLLDLCMIQRMRLDQILRHFPKVMDGTHTTMPQVTMGRARTIEVTTTAPVPVATDGEVIATDATRIRIEILPAAVSLLIE